ncbi:nucleotide-diphospho-sugar transferase [Serendipita vermifera]|nr:nucleotide-diphospho-sugar transferase [Serendipita vermifera]
MEIPVHQSRTRAKPEFQAIILAGLGSQLTPLTSPHGDTPTPRALLPVANKPLLSYGLSWLEEADIKEALIVCPPSHVSALTNHIQTTSPHLKVEIHAFESALDGSTSTIDILRKISSRIHSDFIVLSSDFVPSSSTRLASLLNVWRTDITGMIMACLFYEASEERQKRKDKPIPAIAFKDSSILNISYAEDNHVQIPMHLFEKFGNCRMTRNLDDSHVYVFKRTVLDILPMLPHIQSIRKDLIPFLCSLQYSRTKRKQFSEVLVHPERRTTADNVQEKGSLNAAVAFQYSTTQHVELKSLTPHPRPRSPGATANSWKDSDASSEANSDNESTLEEPIVVPSLRCGLIIQRKEKGKACGRADTLAAYRELNLGLLGEISQDAKGVREGVDPGAKISPDSIWSSTSRIGEGSTVTRSVIGQHCVMGKNVRIVNSIIMEHVELGDGVKIENCILSRHTKVSDKTQVKDCESSPGVEIQANGSDLVITRNTI